MTLSSIFQFLFTPRRSFAFRQLEERCLKLEAERDYYRQKWIDSVDYVQVISGKPRLNVVEPHEPIQPAVRVNPAEIQAAYDRQHEQDFQDYLQKERERRGAPNDVDFAN